MAFGKSEQERLTEVFAYLKSMKVSQNKIDLLFDWVYVDGPFAAETVSNAISLNYGMFHRHGTSKDTRQAIRTLILARLAVETPAAPSLASTASSWKTTYQSQSESQLQQHINTYMNRLVPTPAVNPVAPKNVTPTSYGINQSMLNSAIGNLKAPTPKIHPVSPPVQPPPTASMTDKKQFFETVSRPHVIFSGHGSWAYDGSWPTVKLGPHQVVRFYCDHFYPLGNDAGQLVDNRRFPPAKETYAPGSTMPDYTLQPREKLVLLNKGGGNADQEFITVTANTRVSTFLSNLKYAAATFHWAACRVVVSNSGELECPIHHAWEDFATACVRK